MIEFFVRKTLRAISSTYNQDTILETTFKDKVIATGMYQSTGFELLKGSLIRKRDTLRSNPAVTKAREDLRERKIMIDKDSEYYLLLQDYPFSSPTAAARFVHGNDRNGYKDWKHNGSPLGDLLKRRT